MNHEDPPSDYAVDGVDASTACCVCKVHHEVQFLKGMVALVPRGNCLYSTGDPGDSPDRYGYWSDDYDGNGRGHTRKVQNAQASGAPVTTRLRAYLAFRMQTRPLAARHHASAPWTTRATASLPASLANQVAANL